MKWYKNAVIYELHIKAFFDSNNDGYGDFNGLIQKLDYLSELGVNTIWLLPFYPSPFRDDGYDISEYTNIHPDYGTIEDFKNFINEAHQRGLRVITELVLNHTSDQHPWFQAARSAPPGSPERDFYVWSDNDQKYKDTRIIFTDTEKSNWTWDEEAQAYYWHRFFSHQPDLNFDNPAVVDAAIKVMKYWFDLGVDGMRLDAVPYLIEREGTNCENLAETHQILKQLRKELDANYEDKVLLAEANQWPEDVRSYFGNSDECHMAYHFPVMPRLFMALRLEDRYPISDILRKTPDIPEDCQWAMFLRNHDELTLEMVTDEERDYMYEQYASDVRSRINVGIRRRLTPLLDGDRRKVELLNSLLLSFPGSPIIYYGDEIGMGDNVFLGDRNGVRTPMQWNIDRNGGFSKAEYAELYEPPIVDSVYGFSSVNVESQQKNPSSILNFMKRILAIRAGFDTFGNGGMTLLYPDNRRTLAYLRKDESHTILCVANLSRHTQPVELNLADYAGYTPTELFGKVEFPQIGELPYFLTIAPYGFYWFELSDKRNSVAGIETLPTIPLTKGRNSLFSLEVRSQLERDVLPKFLKKQRWFSGKSKTITSVSISDWTKLDEDDFISVLDVHYSTNELERYLVPLSISSEEQSNWFLVDSPISVAAKLQINGEIAILHDGLLSEQTCIKFLELCLGKSTLNFKVNSTSILATKHLEEEPSCDSPSVQRNFGEQSNSTIFFDSRYALKIFRRLEDGINPEIEIGTALASKANFPNTPAILSGLQLGAQSVAALQKFSPSQGTAWDSAVSEVRRLCEFVKLNPDTYFPDGIALKQAVEGEPDPADIIGSYFLYSASTIGKRTAELHLSLAAISDNPDFQPVNATSSYHELIAAQAVQRANNALSKIDDEALSSLILTLERFSEFNCNSSLIRVHGDFHLGQILKTENDILIIDFEGEPSLQISERRRKTYCLKDVAGIIRSFSYASFQGLHLEKEIDSNILTHAVKYWDVQISAAFLRAYLERVKENDSNFLPKGNSLWECLNFFLIDKAFYELDYELNNRPDWVHIPISGLKNIVI